MEWGPRRNGREGWHQRTVWWDIGKGEKMDKDIDKSWEGKDIAVLASKMK